MDNQGEEVMKIALLGSAPSSIALAPFKNDAYHRWVDAKRASIAVVDGQIPGDFDLWGCSPGCWSVIPRATRWFEVHRWEPGQAWFSPEYCQFLRDFSGPVYTGAPVPEIQNHVVYPIDRIEARFSSYFLTSSLALMMALAIDEIEQARELRPKLIGTKPEDHDPPLESDDDDVIGMWGVDMAACPSPETRVLTADLRWVPAGDLKVGDKLIAFDEEATPGVGGNPGKRMWRTTEVLRADPIMKPCYRVFLEDDREIVCSDEHKWLTYAENQCRWRETKDLVTSHHRPDRPTRIVKLCDVWEEDRSWAAGYLAAAFDGEGHLTQKLREGHYGLLRAGFSQRANPMSEEVLDITRHMGFELGLDSRGEGENGDTYKFSIRGGRTKTMEFLGRIRPRRLMEKFDPGNLGVLQKTGTVAVTAIESIGEQPVIGLTTGTGTFIAEGLATHNTEEYAFQRPGCQFFVLEALRRGIGVYLPSESDLMRPMPVYGISEWDHNYIKLTARARELNQKMQESGNTEAEAIKRKLLLQGELGALNAFVQTWTNPFGMRHGLVVRQTPGTGLGGGVTHVDERPIVPKPPRMVTTVTKGDDPEDDTAVPVMSVDALTGDIDSRPGQVRWVEDDEVSGMGVVHPPPVGFGVGGSTDVAGKVVPRSEYYGTTLDEKLLKRGEAFGPGRTTDE